MMRIIGKLLTFIIFAGLMIYLAGLYGLPRLGSTILAAYGFPDAHINSAAIHSQSFIFRNIRLADTQNGVSRIDKVRVAYNMAPPFIPQIIIDDAQAHIHVSAQNGISIAGIALPRKMQGSRKSPLTVSQIIEAIRLPTIPVGSITVRDMRLIVTTPVGTYHININADLSRERRLNARLSGREPPLTFELPIIADFNQNTGQLQRLSASLNSVTLAHPVFSIKNGSYQLDYINKNTPPPHLHGSGEFKNLKIAGATIKTLRAKSEIVNNTLRINIELPIIAYQNSRIESIETQLDLAGLMPLATDGTQRFTIQKAGIGVPITAITGAYRIADNKGDFIRLDADFAKGRISVENTDRPDTYVVTLRELDLSTLSNYAKTDGLSMNGRVNGRIPIRFNNHKGLMIQDGMIQGGENGFIHYQPETYPPALRGENIGMRTTRNALRHLDLAHLKLTLSGSMKDKMDARLTIKGHNRNFSDRPVHINLNLSGDIIQALQQSLNINLGTTRLDASQLKLLKNK